MRFLAHRQTNEYAHEEIDYFIDNELRFRIGNDDESALKKLFNHFSKRFFHFADTIIQRNWNCKSAPIFVL